MADGVIARLLRMANDVILIARLLRMPMTFGTGQ